MQAARTVGIVEMAKLAGMVELASAMPIRTVVFLKLMYLYTFYLYLKILY